jgi:hypothetical protein
MVKARNPDKNFGFQVVRFSDAQDWHKIESETRPRSGIRILTVIQKVWHLANGARIIFDKSTPGVDFL